MKKTITLSLLFTAIFAASSAFAQGDMAEHASSAAAGNWIAIAAGIGMALASFGGAIGQSQAISKAVEGIARNPGAQNKIFLPMIIGLALIESLVLLTFVVANGLLKKF